MLITLIRRELLDNLMAFRFAVSVFITLLLVVSTSAVLINDYERRLADYNTSVETHYQRLRRQQVYSSGMNSLSVDRAPNPLSLFKVGLDKRLGNNIRVSYWLVPSLWDAKMNGSNNSFLNIFASIDLVFILQMILSLLALIFAYDALAGERESGTLRLVLTHPVGRGYILLAKYISAMICLLVPLLMSLILTGVLITTSPSIALRSDDLLRIGGIALTSFAYLSIFYLIGLLISAITRRASTALMLSIFIWGFLILVYPNMILAAIAPETTSTARLTSAFNEIKQIWEAFERDRRHFLATDAVPGEDPRFGMDGPSGWSWGAGFREDRLTLSYYYWSVLYYREFYNKHLQQVPHAQNYYSFLGPQIIDAAERTWLIRKQALEETRVRSALLDRILLKLSPVGMYDTATQAWAGTDLKGIQDFFDAVRQYRQNIIDYLYAKKAFRARQWFASDKNKVDWDTLPNFSFKRSNIVTNAKRALPDMFLLLMLNTVLFLIIFLIFVKSEV